MTFTKLKFIQEKWHKEDFDVDQNDIPKTQKVELDPSLLNTHPYNVGIMSNEEQSREKSSTFSYTSV